MYVYPLDIVHWHVLRKAAYFRKLIHVVNIHLQEMVRKTHTSTSSLCGPESIEQVLDYHNGCLEVK